MENNKDLTVTSTSEVVAEATAKRDLLNMAYKQAQFYASSTIVPAEYQNNPSNCFIAIEMANRMGANPFQVMQSLNVIKGKPSWSSAFIIAAVNQSGRFKTPINYQMKGDWSKGDLECVAWAISKDGTKCESIKVTQKMANAEGWVQKNGSKWQTMPELMIRYRAAAFFGRQYCPDLLLGLMTTEEQKDIIEADYEEVDAKIATEKVEEHQNKTMASVKVTVNENPETGEVKEEKVATEKVETPANEGIFNYEV